MTLPPRSPRLPGPLRLSFDVDCDGVLDGGRTVVARGLLDDGRSRDDLSGHRDGVECDVVSLLVEIVPGLPAGSTLTVDATYAADVALPWSTGGTGPEGLGGPCWYEEPDGGASTLGGLGPWPVPEGTRSVEFWLSPSTTGRAAGNVQVDLERGSAHWVPRPDAG